MATKTYNFATVITNYLYRQNSTSNSNSETIAPLSCIPDGLLIGEELELKVAIIEHERQYSTPTIETIRLASNGSYEHLIETHVVDGKEIPIRGHGESYQYLLNCFDEFSRSRRLTEIINGYDVSDENSEITVEDTLNELIDIPSITFGETEDFFSTYDEEIKELDEEAENGISLGINRRMDSQLGLIHRGKIGLIAGNTGTNKTWILVLLAFRAAFLEGKKVLFMSYEMSSTDVGKRVKAIIGQYNTRLYSVRTTENKKILDANTKIVYSIKDFYLGNGKLVPMIGASVPEVKAELDRELEETGTPYDLILFDGATLIPAPAHLSGSASWMKTVANLDMLKDIKLGSWTGDKTKVQYPIILSGQMGKGKTGDSLADLGDSVRLAQDSDFVVNVQGVAANIRSSKILKNRNGVVPDSKYYYAIDYHTSSILGAMSEDTDFDKVVDENSDGWEKVFATLSKKDLPKFFDDIDEELVKTASKRPNLEAPMVYKSTITKEFVYPSDKKDIYDQFTPEDKERWNDFVRTTPNKLLVKSYEAVIMRNYK